MPPAPLSNPNAPKGAILTFGELMMRLCPPGNARLEGAGAFTATWGGSEANVGVSLARLGATSRFVTRMPPGPLGDGALRELRGHGVDVSCVARGGTRLGLYFVEMGLGPRASRVEYDRAGSAFASIGPSDIDLKRAFDGVRWLHWSGVTPSLGEGPRALVESLCAHARGAGVTVSCDLNYRAKLWSPERAREVMAPLMQYVDVCIGNEEDARLTLGMGDHDLSPSSEDAGARYTALGNAMRESYGFRTVAFSLRESLSATRNRWSAMLSDHANASEGLRSRVYDLDIADRFGAGDAFAAGLIWSLARGDGPRAAIEFAAAAGAIKHTIPGDFNTASHDEIASIASGSLRGRVVR